MSFIPLILAGGAIFLASSKKSKKKSAPTDTSKVTVDEAIDKFAEEADKALEEEDFEGGYSGIAPIYENCEKIFSGKNINENDTELCLLPDGRKIEQWELYRNKTKYLEPASVLDESLEDMINNIPQEDIEEMLDSLPSDESLEGMIQGLPEGDSLEDMINNLPDPDELDPDAELNPNYDPSSVPRPLPTFPSVGSQNPYGDSLSPMGNLEQKMRCDKLMEYIYERDYQEGELPINETVVEQTILPTMKYKAEQILSNQNYPLTMEEASPSIIISALEAIAPDCGFSLTGLGWRYASGYVMDSFVLEIFAAMFPLAEQVINEVNSSRKTATVNQSQELSFKAVQLPQMNSSQSGALSISPK